MCLYKKRLLNPRYLPNKKNNYTPPKITDEKFKYIEAECGNCIECRKKKAREWSIRITEELKVQFGYFITLTISPEEMKLLMKAEGVGIIKGNENAIAKLAWRRCLERIRKETGKSLRHWCVTELGEKNDRIHLHGIVFGQKGAELIRKHWKYGHIFIGTYCSARTANYITKYMLKMDVKHQWFTGRVFTSAGIGKAYVHNARFWKRYRGVETNNTYTCKNGKEISMPTYYKNKLYTDDEKQELWAISMATPWRYIHGEKIRKEDEQLARQLEEFYRMQMIKTKLDNPEDWKIRKKMNKLSRRAEAKRKAHKERLKNKEGLVENARVMLIERNLREIKQKSYCRFKENAILLKRQQRKYKQLNLFTL